ncbi:hypothetical protein CDAR_448751 [Caerostris darwini]|uniref:Uncharacterized protein n=1 Tax=Caerostris darwini TaxID=1538125 RepID=A0AAV4QP83_9ARAC|nr:hypothetical protein CDAR_448751 [Caerostris darwini]
MNSICRVYTFRQNDNPFPDMSKRHTLRFLVSPCHPRKVVIMTTGPPIVMFGMGDNLWQAVAYRKAFRPCPIS